MKETDDLEPQQYKRLYWEEDVPVKDVRKNALRKFVYIGSLLCFVMIFAGLVIRFPDQIELPFIIKSNKSEEIYRFSSPVYVTGVYSKPGEKVKKGQSLIKITSPEIVQLVNNFNEAEQNLKNFRSQKLLSVNKQKAISQLKIEQNKNKITETENELVILDDKWNANKTRLEYEKDIARKKYDINKKFFEDGSISKFELIEFETRNLKATDTLESALQDYNKNKLTLNYMKSQYALDINTLTAEIEKSEIDSKYDSVGLINQFALIKNKISNTYGDFNIANGDIIIRAKTDGIISYIFEGEKEVATGSILMKLISGKSVPYAWVKAPASLIGKILTGEKVVLKVASFPFYEWGTVQGHISNQSLTPDENGNFSVKISLENLAKFKGRIQVGMDGNATIILDEKTFFNYFFRKVKKTYYKAAMEE